MPLSAPVFNHSPQASLAQPLAGQRPVNKRTWLLLILMALIVGSISIAGLTDLLGRQPQTEWLLAGAAGLVIVVVYRSVLKLALLSPVILYMLIFWMFHLGLVFPAAVFPEILAGYPSWALDRLFSLDGSIAVIASIIFMASFAVGTLLVKQRPEEVETDRQRNQGIELVPIGWVLIVGGLLLTAGALINFGLDVILKSYSDFFQISNSFTYPVLVISYGLVLQAAGGRNRRSIIITMLWSYGPIALATTLAGARTVPLFTLVVLIVVLTRKGLKVSRTTLILAAVAALILTATIREVRQVGLADVFAAQGEITIQSPLSGLTELGGSLMPVIATVNYMHIQDLYLGETYIYPVLRQIQRLLGQDIGTPNDDPRFIAAWINSLYGGGIGYSTVAEAYANGGFLGVVLFALLWGVVFRLLERRSYTPYGLALFVAVLIPMMINIRNSFIYVPAWIVLASLPLIMAKAFKPKPSLISPRVDVP